LATPARGSKSFHGKDSGTCLPAPVVICYPVQLSDSAGAIHVEKVPGLAGNRKKSVPLVWGRVAGRDCWLAKCHPA